MKDKSLSHIFKLSLYFFLRIILICALSMMASTLALRAPIMNPILGIFYFLVLIYFVLLTFHHEGMSDRNRVETGLIRKNTAKGWTPRCTTADFAARTVAFFSARTAWT